MLDKNCPCTKDCPDRNVDFCRSCEKLKKYRAEKEEEYNKRKAEFEFKLYENGKWDKQFRRTANFKKGVIK